VQREVEVAYGPAVGAGVAEADIVERETLADRRRERARLRRRIDLGLDLEEGEQSSR
jgi:hypothetical protein